MSGITVFPSTFKCISHFDQNGYTFKGNVNYTEKPICVIAISVTFLPKKHMWNKRGNGKEGTKC